MLEPQLLFGYVLNSTRLSFFIYQIRITVRPIPQVYYCYLFFFLPPVILWLDMSAHLSSLSWPNCLHLSLGHCFESLLVLLIPALIFSVCHPVTQQPKWLRKPKQPDQIVLPSHLKIILRFPCACRIKPKRLSMTSRDFRDLFPCLLHLLWAIALIASSAWKVFFTLPPPAGSGYRRLTVISQVHLKWSLYLWAFLTPLSQLISPSSCQFNHHVHFLHHNTKLSFAKLLFSSLCVFPPIGM